MLSRKRGISLIVIGDRVVIRVPTRGDCQVFRRHGGGNLRIPSVKAASRFFRVFGGLYLGGVVLRDRKIILAVIKHEGDRVLVDGVMRGEGGVSVV